MKIPDEHTHKETCPYCGKELNNRYNDKALAHQYNVVSHCCEDLPFRLTYIYSIKTDPVQWTGSGFCIELN